MRCFVAIELTDGIRREIARVQETLRDADGVRWTRADSVHLTVKFLGNVADGLAPDLCEALAAAAGISGPFEMTVGGVGCFPPRGNPRIVWVGADEPTGRLVECVGLVEEAYADLGFAPEKRAYTPHVTIGRVKSPRKAKDLRDRLARHESFAAGAQSVEELVLFQSDLRPSGAVYTPVFRAPLGE